MSHPLFMIGCELGGIIAVADKIDTWSCTSVIVSAPFGYVIQGETVAAIAAIGMVRVVAGEYWTMRADRPRPAHLDTS